MRGKAALIVVDDVWSAHDLEPFRAESPRSRPLFTTRNESIAAELAAKPIDPGFLTPLQARKMLARWSGIAEASLPVEADELIGECGGLILAIATIGAMLRGKPLSRWRHVTDLLRNSPLDKIQRILQVSIDALEPKARERYYALAVLLEDMPADPLIQQTLWGTGPAGAIETADELIRLSLAQRMADGESIQLHDLLLDLVSSHYPDPEALKTIRNAMRLSAHVIERDPAQFASQLVGRLLPYAKSPAVGEFAQGLARNAPRPWLRPLSSTLQPPGTGLLRTLAGHADRVWAVAVTSDGQRAVSASADHTLKVWDLQSGRELHTLAGHADSVWAVAVTADDQRAVSASDDHTLKVWDLQSGREIATFTCDSRVYCSVSSDLTVGVMPTAAQNI